MASVDPGPRVLIVDDDECFARALAEILTDVGYDVGTAANGKAALRHLRTEPLPAVILLDLQMPVMGGRSFRAAQLRQPSTAAVPVVVMSGATNPEKASFPGAAGYLRKPFLVQQMLSTVDACLRGGDLLPPVPEEEPALSLW